MRACACGAHSRVLRSQFFLSGKTLPIERGQGLRQPAMQTAAQLLAQGDWVHLFPEGRVSFSGRLQACRWGVGKLICDAVTQSGRSAGRPMRPDAQACLPHREAQRQSFLCADWRGPAQTKTPGCRAQAGPLMSLHCRARFSAWPCTLLRGLLGMTWSTLLGVPAEVPHSLGRSSRPGNDWGAGMVMPWGQAWQCHAGQAR